MSIYKLLVNTLRLNLPKHRKTSKYIGVVPQRRTMTSMEAVVLEKKDAEEIIIDKYRTRYRQRFRKREWEDAKKEDGETDKKKVCENPTDRIKRKKMVLLLGYCGVDYHGMQRNPGVKTIEEDLCKALYEANYITEMDFNNLQNAQFQRSSRTDKGVSAARQVVSLKLPLETNVEEINKRLPEAIKVFSVKRVTNTFNSKLKCNARTYSYTLPTYVFEPSVVTHEERRQYRIPAEKLEQINKVLGYYKGNKKYHNFTEKKHPSDPSASRYMMGFTVDKIFVDSDLEFAVLLVKGQSFMLHQIRKMVGLMIAIVRGNAEPSIMDKVFEKEKVMIPTAPGLGLVLDRVHYEKYAARYKGSHDSLSWEAEEEAIDKFKHEHIYPTIIKGEINDDSMGQWLEKLNRHNYEPSDDNGEKDVRDKGDDDDEVNDVEKEDDVDDSKASNEKVNEKTKDISTISDEKISEIAQEVISDKKISKNAQEMLSNEKIFELANEIISDEKISETAIEMTSDEKIGELAKENSKLKDMENSNGVKDIA